MSDIVTLTLELNEKVSGGIQKAAVTTHSAFEGIGRDISGAQRGLDELGNERRIRVDHSSVREAQGAVEGLGEAMRGLSEMQLIGGMALGELVARGVERSADFAKEQITDVLKGGMEEGSLQLQMKVLAGDEPGKELYEQIHNYIPKSLFGPELNHEAVVLLGMNETVKNILPDLKEFGDISMGDAQKMQSLILALGEAKAQGHLSGLEMRILRTTGFNPLVETARVTGETMEHLTERMAEGKFSFEDLRRSMEYATSEGGRFNHMQERMLETPGGQYKEMVTNIEQAKTELGLALLPAEANVMKAFMPLIESLPEELERMRPSMEHIINDFAELVKWTSNNTETIGKWVGLIKVGVEAWAAWKVGTTALTAINWLWVTSIGAQETATLTAATAIDAETAAILEQTAVVEANNLAWLSMSSSRLAALDANAAASFGLPINMAGVAGMGGGALAGGFAGGVASAALPVFIAYFATEALAQMLPDNPLTGEGWTAKSMLLASSGSIGGNQLPQMELMMSLFGIDPMQEAQDAYNKKHASPVTGTDDFINDNWAALGQYKNPYFPNASWGAAGEAGGKGGAGAGKLAAAADSIIGGGPRQINITAKFMEHAVNHFAGGKAGGKETMESMREEYYKMLKSIPGMH